MLIVENVSLSFGSHKILENISVSATKSRILGLVGPNGAGKTSLLNIMYRTLSPDAGQMRIDDIDMRTLTRRQIAQRISVVVQQSADYLPIPVRDSVALGRLAKHSIIDYGGEVAEEKIKEAIAKVGLTGFEDRLTNELSGGELQRVLIARAILQETSHVLLDEPTNHLDINAQYLILQMVRDLDVTTVIVLHDLNLAMQFCDDIVLLDKGRIVAAGEPESVLTPERIAQVYHMDADLIYHDGNPHLVYRGRLAETA